MLNFSVTSFQKPKEHSFSGECEDCYAYDADNKLTFAIADSVSNSHYSNKWAKLLVRDYRRYGNTNFEDRMPLLQKKWHDAINWSALSDFEEIKAERGDSSTFLGVTFHHQFGHSGTWDAIAIGDSCLFQVRSGSLVRSFPIAKSGDFSPRVDSLCSTDLNIRAALSSVIKASGDFNLDDLFIIATDAVSKWFLSRCEIDSKISLSIEKLADCGRLSDLFNALLKLNKLEDDDITILIVKPQILPPLVV